MLWLLSWSTLFQLSLHGSSFLPCLLLRLWSVGWAHWMSKAQNLLSSLAHWKYLTAPRCQVCRIPEGRRYSKVITTESVRQESKKTRACLSVLNADTAVSYCLQSGRTSDTLSLKSEGCHAWRSGVWSGLERCLDPCTCCSILPAMRWLRAVLYQEHTVTSSEPVEYGSKPVALINNKKISILRNNNINGSCGGYSLKCASLINWRLLLWSGTT